ncbi:MAG: O-acetylhomoserine aminocarboxypropyltransferase/cysteine synthase [Desulfovibrio sp.]|nr:O-acetylhomoserine aminocarboxypropyltransferase/cysteine synthase [Desulfovibrio sp.]
MHRETQCLHAGYTPKNGEPRVLPIVQSTTFTYESTDEVARLFNLETSGFFYTRLGNPTVDCVEKKIAALEGGVGAMCTSSGQAASTLACLTILKSGDHMVSASSIYGGTFNLFAVTFKRLGIDVTFVDQNATDEELSKAFRPNTKLVYGETLTNPSMDVLDIERIANLAHAHNVPLIVDNTFATPILCRPFDFGADIVVHSTTKYMDGHAVQMGGVICDSGNFDWKAAGHFPEFTEPDPSYHGLSYTGSFGKMAFIVKARAQLMRDIGACQTAQGAFYLNLGLETLPLRMERHAKNGMLVATFLASHPKVNAIQYPALPGSRDLPLVTKYLPKGICGVMSFELQGGREAGARFIDHLSLVSLEVHVADIRSCVLHPASSTHRQLTDEQLAACGISPGLIRLSVGLEHPDDIIQDISQALDA